MAHTTKIVTSAIIRNEESNILIVKRAAHDSFPNTWEFPGGKADFGEDPEESVKREILEETDLSIIPLFPVVVKSYKSQNKIGVVYVEIFYIAQLSPADQTVTLSKEHSEFAWVPLDEIKNYKATEYIHTVIERIQHLNRI